MATPVKYKPPRRINVVSVSIVGVSVLLLYVGYKTIPVYFMSQEAYRVLEETGSKFSGRKRYYIADRDAREKLRRNMEADLRRVGVSDPDIETWIDVEEPEVRIGVLYSVFTQWPLLDPSEKVYELEHVINVR